MFSPLQLCTVCSVQQQAFGRPLLRAYTSLAPVNRVPVRRHLLFTLLVGLGSTGLAIYATEQDTAKWRARAGQHWWSRQTTTPTGLVPNYARLRLQELSARLQRVTVSMGESWRLPELSRREWISLPESKRTISGILVICTSVFVVWNVPRAQSFARQYLWHNPLSNRVVTLLTSTFAHKSLPHLAFNSIALWSIGTATYTFLDRSRDRPRSTSRYEFLSLFVTAGVLSALGSHLWAARVVAPRVLARATSSASIAGILPSLGSSGAIYSCLMITGLAYPEANVALIFVPFIPIPIGGACAAMVCVDVVGLVRGWQMFDHAAHLTGALYGIWYFYMGHHLFERLRTAVPVAHKNDIAHDHW